MSINIIKFDTSPSSGKNGHTTPTGYLLTLAVPLPASSPANPLHHHTNHTYWAYLLDKLSLGRGYDSSSVTVSSFGNGLHFRTHEYIPSHSPLPTLLHIAYCSPLHGRHCQCLKAGSRCAILGRVSALFTPR